MLIQPLCLCVALAGLVGAGSARASFELVEPTLLHPAGVSTPYGSDFTPVAVVAAESSFKSPLQSTPPAPPAVQADAPAQTTALRLPYGGLAERSLAVRLGRHAVGLTALEQAARAFSRKPAARLFTDEIPRLVAVIAPTHRLTLDDADVEPLAGGGESAVRVQATLARTAPEDEYLRQSIAAGHTLDTEAMAYSRMSRLTAEGLRLLRDAAILRREGGDDAPQVERLHTVLERLDNLALLLRSSPPDPATLETLLAREPENPLFLLETADSLLRARQPALALDTLGRLDKASKSIPRALYLRGVAELALRLPGLALQSFSRAVERVPDDPAYLAGRASAFGTLGDTGAMCRDLAASCALGYCTPLEEARLLGNCRE